MLINTKWLGKREQISFKDSIEYCNFTLFINNTEEMSPQSSALKFIPQLYLKIS